MLKVGIIITVLAAIFIVEGFFISKRFITIDPRWKGYKIISYVIEHKTYRLLVADTNEKWSKGLMDVRTLENLDGMMFVFPTREHKTFWNERTLMDLQLVWIDGEKVVGKTLLPSIEKKGRKTVTSPKPVNVVVELVRM